MFDVIVVGGGPVGSYTAGQLAALGHRVAVCEKKPSPGADVCCTGILGRDGFETLSLGNMVTKSILRDARAASFFSPSGKSLRLSKDVPQAYIVDRSAFDDEFARWAGRVGVEYMLGTGVRVVHPDDGTAVVETDTGDTLRAKAVVLACGYGSQLPHRLGLGSIHDFVIGAQAEVALNGVEDVEVYIGQHVAPGFFAWLVPTSPGRGLAGILSRHQPGEKIRLFLSGLMAQGKIMGEHGEVGYGVIPLRTLPRTSCDRVVVVGDAAGQVKPLTGGGIYYGLLSAKTAVDVIDRGLKNGNLSQSHLSQYDAGWRRQLSRELKLGNVARKIYEKLTDRQIEWLFELFGHDGIAQSMLEAEDFSFDWHGRMVLRALKHEAIGSLLRSVRAGR